MPAAEIRPLRYELSGEASTNSDHKWESYGTFCKLVVLFVGVLIVRALLFGVYTRALDFGKLPYQGSITIIVSDC